MTYNINTSTFVCTKSKLSTNGPCLIYSRLLSLPQDVTDLLLEYVAAEPKAILDLRQVCTVTKGWVDSLSINRSQSRRIFSKIPIYLNLNYNDLEKFNTCPPPPSACSLKLQVEKRNRNYEHMELLKSLRTIFPSFFEFWRNQMISLSVQNYSSKLLDTLGPPKTLRELTCTRYMLETHQSLLQLETIEYNSDLSTIKFFRHLARSRNLKRLSIKISLNKYEDSNLGAFDKLERLRILLDARRNDKDFHLDIHTMSLNCADFQEENLLQFLTSFGESASCIRMFAVSNGFSEQVFNLISTTLSPIDGCKVLQKFFDSIHLYLQEGELSESVLILGRFLFKNLKTLSLYIREQNEDEFTSTESLKFPSGIESLHIISRSGVLLPRNLPKSLRSLSLQRWIHSSWRSDNADYTTGIELAECLSLISQRCPVLEELEMDSGIFGSCGFPVANTKTKDPSYAFKSKLKIFLFYTKTY